MRNSVAPVGFLALTAFGLDVAVTPAAVASCASLAGLALPDTTITIAQMIPAGPYTAPNGAVFTNLPPFCRIAATLTPTSDSNIKVEVWMPFAIEPQLAPLLNSPVSVSNGSRSAEAPLSQPRGSGTLRRSTG
jgi:hypothetical protein